MGTTPPVGTDSGTSVDYWKGCYEKQKFLVNSMTSLLNRYGSSVEREQLYSAFLLTLMGQFVAGGSCYYPYASDGGALQPALAYGRLTCADLPPITVGARIVSCLQQDPSPIPFESLPLNVAAASGMRFLAGNYGIFAPLFLKEKLVGILFLGNKISGQPFSQSDLDILQSLCAVSAITFNNSILYDNARYSAREIQRLYEIRNEVINRITHEFRTPLTIIKAGIGMLEKDKTNPVLIDLFSESELRLEDLINSLLSLSHTISGDDDSAVRTDPIVVMHDSLSHFSDLASKKQIQFNIVQNVGSTAQALHMKEADFRTVLDALLENAIKFSPAGACVTIEIEQTTDAPSTARDGLVLPDWREQTEDLIREYRDMAPDDRQAGAKLSAGINGREFLVIRVADDGIGIPEQDLVSVAEPFRQASNSPDLNIKGKGLGLALAHKVVSRHGGHLCCKSAEGCGAKFSVYLPIGCPPGL